MQNKKEIIIFLWAFALLLTSAVKVGASALMYVDRGVLIHLRYFVTPAHTVFFKWIAFSGSPIVTLLLAVGLAIIFYQQRKPLLSMVTLVSIIGGDALFFIIKEVVRRPRPSNPVIASSGYSFPSGHTFGTVIIALLIWRFIILKLKSERLQVQATLALGLWVVLVMLSRLYLQVHYPSDVLAAVVFAVAWWSSVLAFYADFENKMSTKVHQNMKIE